MYGVDGRGTYYLECLVEGETFVLDVVAKTLQVDMGSVSLVAVVSVVLDAQLLEHEHTTDTQHILLLQSVFPVTTVKLRGDETVVFAVLLQVGIHQVEVDSTYRHFPDVSVNASVIERNVQNDWIAVLVLYLADRKRIEVLWLIDSDLLSIHRE